MRDHEHQPEKTTVRRYTGPVSRDENRAAHGNVTYRDHCACGAVRDRNVNGRHSEIGDWFDPPQD